MAKWKTAGCRLADAVGTVVRSIELNVNGRSGPKDFEWDGTNNDGRRVPDGMYTLKLSTMDEAGNKAASEVRNITIDTTKPAVSIAMDGSVMSPNGDGIRDTLHVLPSFESLKNLITWEIAILNPEKNKVWSVSGGADSLPEKSYTLPSFPPTEALV